MKDKVMISDWKEIHKFFSDAKQRKVVFYITFGDPSEQAVGDFRISEIRFRPQKTTKASGNNVTVELEALRNQDVKFVIKSKEKLRIDFIDEGFAQYFDIEVVNVNSTKLGLFFTFKLPDQVNNNSYHDELRLPARRDKKIKMTLSGQSVDVIHISSKGASVLLPHANIDDVKVGKAIRLIELKVDGYKLKANAEINYIREHLNGSKILTDLRFMYFGIDDESSLEKFIAEKSALLTLKQMMTRYSKLY